MPPPPSPPAPRPASYWQTVLRPAPPLGQPQYLLLQLLDVEQLVHPDNLTSTMGK